MSANIVHGGMLVHSNPAAMPAASADTASARSMCDDSACASAGSSTTPPIATQAHASSGRRQCGRRSAEAVTHIPSSRPPASIAQNMVSIAANVRARYAGPGSVPPSRASAGPAAMPTTTSALAQPPAAATRRKAVANGSG